MAAWVEPYTRLYQDYRARLDAATQRKLTENIRMIVNGLKDL